MVSKLLGLWEAHVPESSPIGSICRQLADSQAERLASFGIVWEESHLVDLDTLYIRQLAQFASVNDAISPS